MYFIDYRTESVKQNACNALDHMADWELPLPNLMREDYTTYL